MTKECGFRQLQSEKCLYIKHHNDGSYMLVCMYVDDLVIAYSHRSMLDEFIMKVKSKFKITQTDSLQKTLGFQIQRTKTGGVFMHQASYIADVLKRFRMEDCRPVDTPFDHRIRLCKTGAYNARSGVSSAATQGENEISEAYLAHFKKRKKSAVADESKIPYRELIGCLLWISMGTRPDLSLIHI